MLNIYTTQSKLNKINEEKTNRGGILGGAGYLGGSLVAGIGSIGEGLADLFMAAGAVAGGDKDYAKYVFKDNVVGEWHESITSDYNPGKVMQFIGDVSHGLGQSSVFLLDAVGVPVGTVGFFGGMIGQGISGAAAKTGDVGFKEVAYGTLSGAAEGALEKAMGGMSKLAGGLKNVTKTAVRKGLFRQVLSDAASEFGEEFLSEYVDVALQRVTGVDKQASTTLKNAIYSGFVGAVSGTVSAGAGDIAKYSANQRNGAKIIASGNAQTLVNTATAVADKMAAQGTDFKKAAEWVKALRAEVNAYNKLTPEAQKGARGQTILGEMQASLYFAETQAVFNGVQVGIQNADEEKRAALAEYVNLTVDKSKRSKDYTAEDVAKNTDNIAWQLSVLHYANHIADLDAVMAQEEAVQGLIKEEQGAETAVPEAAQAPTVQVPQTENNVPQPESVTVDTEERKNKIRDTLKGAVEQLRFDGNIYSLSAESYEKIAQAASKYISNGATETEAIAKAVNESVQESDILSEGNKIAHIYSKEKISKLKGAIINAYRDSVNNQKAETKKAEKKEAYNKQLEKRRAEEEAVRKEKSDNTKKIVDKIKSDLNDVSVDENLLTQTVESFLERYSKSGDAKLAAKMAVINNVTEVKLQDGTVIRSSTDHGKAISKYRRSIANTLVDASPKSDSESNTKIKPKTETKTEPQKAEPEKLTPTREEKLARAKERAEKWKSFEEKTQASAQEMNLARSYVKNFDELDNHRRSAILQTVRSARESGTRVDDVALRGVVNLMSLTRSNGEGFGGELEVRFAQGIKEDGLYTRVNGKPVIVIDAKAESGAAMRSTVIHELVHYVENKEGYKALADYVMKTARPEKKDAIRKEYEDFYKENEIEYSEEDIHSEIVARLVGERLQSEKFLKRYAEKDASMIKRAAGFIKGLRKATKDADEEAERITGEIMLRMDRALAGADVKESDGGKKYALAIHYSNGTIEEFEDARSVTNKQVLNYLKQAKKGELKGHSYIPVKSHTPQVIIETMKQVNENVDDLSLVMQVKKAQQSMRVQNPGNRNTQHGSNVRTHALNPEDIVAIIENLDNPQMIIYQTNRIDKDGNSLPNNIAVFVEYKNGENESVAIVEFNSSIDMEYINDDYGETAYHTVVTVFNPDTERNGISYDYAEELLSNPDNIELEIERGLSERSATQEKHPNTSSELPSKNSIPQKTDLSTDSEKKYALKKKKGAESGGSDVYFENATLRMQVRDLEQSYNKLLEEATDMAAQIHHLQNTKEAYAEGLESKGELLKGIRKKYRDVVIELEETRAEMRQMGYDFEHEKRVSKNYLNQVLAQKEEIKQLREEKKERLRKDAEEIVYKDIEKREAARAAKMYAKQRSEFGKVYDEKEIKEAIDDMLKRGRISQFFGGQYVPKLPKNQINGIAEYIALQLNLAGKAEGRQANDLISVATRDIMKRITFTDSESGELLYLEKIVDEESQKEFSSFIEADLINMFQNIGTLNPYAELMRKYKLLREEYIDKGKKSKEQKEIGEEFPKVYQAALKLKKMAAQGKGSFSDSVEKIAKELGGLVDESGHLHMTKIDNAMRALSKFLEGEEMKMQSERERLSDEARVANDALTWSVDPGLKPMVEEFIHLRRDREGKALTAEELTLLHKTLNGMKTTIDHYNKEFINGHWVDIDQASTEEVEELVKTANVLSDREYKTKIGAWFGQKLGKGITEAYFYKILSPETVVSALEGYRENGLLKTMYRTVREAQAKSNTMYMRMMKPLANFLDDKDNAWEGHEDSGGKENKKYSYRDKLQVKTINVNGTEMTLGEGINLLMLTKRQEAHAGLMEGGYITVDKNGKRLKTKLEDIPRARDLIYNQLDKTDIKFLEMAETFFNETASKIKYDADIKIFGYSNNAAGYYVPMVRDHFSRMKGVTDARFSIGETVTLYSPSFTKSVVANAKALEGQNVITLIEHHARGLADYSELYLPLKAFDRVYNHGVVTEGGEVRSVREVLNTEIWDGTEQYMKDLFSDVQHQRERRDNVVDKLVGGLRSGWVNSVLGANVKVVATQTTSLGAATQVIDPKYVTRASRVIVTKNLNELRERAYKYSNLIEARSFDMGALKAQGNIDKVTSLGEKSGFMIGWMDERVCLSIFHAAELKVESETGFAVGTEENAIRAAKIADETIFTTQAMNDATEKSALQRSPSEIAKLFSMFTSDIVKNLSHLYGNVMKYIFHKKRADAGEAGYAELLSKDKADVKRSVRTLAITGVMLGLISQLFKYIYAKEEEEPEEKVKDFAIDVASSTLNIFPIVSDVIDKLFLDYDISMNVLDVANDTLDSVRDGIALSGRAMMGEYVSGDDAMSTTLEILMAGAQVFGIPVKPVERTLTGLARRFTPSLVYGYDAMFANPSYTSDLKDAVENGNERLAEHILERLYKSEAAGVYNSAELEEVARLFSAGYENVLPQKVGESVNNVKLTRTQRRQFNSIYAGASAAVEKMMATEAFADLTDEQKAKAIKNLYSLYYNRASAEVAGAEWSNAQAYSHLTSDMGTLFVAQAYKAGAEAYVDSEGREITVRDQIAAYVKNLGLSESDEVVMLYALGYRDKTTKASMLSYINSLSLTDEEKAKIAEKLGFDIVNGAVSLKVE